MRRHGRRWTDRVFWLNGVGAWLPPRRRAFLCATFRPSIRELQPQFEAALARVLESGQVILGPEVAALEEEVARYCGVAYGVGCGSGTDALSLALHALEIGPGDEVILPTFTFFATAGSVCRTGARPVFVDIDPITYNLDPFQVESKITPRTRAVLPVHLFGQCADMEGFGTSPSGTTWSSSRTPPSRSAPSTRASGPAASAASACLSFYPTKNLGGFGDGGMVVTSDPDWAARMACLRVHGMEPKYYHKYHRLERPPRRHAGGHAARQAAAPGPLAGGPASGGPALRRPDRGAPSRPFPPSAHGAAAPPAHLQPVRGARGRRASATPWCSGSRRSASAARFTIPFRCTCRNAWLTSATGRATSPPAKRRAAACWRCRCSRNSPSSSSGGVVGSCAAFLRKRSRMAA